MRVLALTTIFPNCKNPKYAPYTLQQAKELSKIVDLTVWAAIPWFPGEKHLSRFSTWARDYHLVPERDTIHGQPVEHPRFLRIPRVGQPVSAATFAASMLPRLRALDAKPDVLFATWAFPDGAAAVLLGRLLGIPVVLQVIGSDINEVATIPVVRAQLTRILPHARGVVAVSQPLADAVVPLGVQPSRTHVICTGVDLERFRPRSRDEALEALGRAPDDRVILYVGRLVREKGLLELFDAFETLQREDDHSHLVIIGDGEARDLCATRAAELGPRVHMIGEAGHDVVAQWVAASRLVTLPSYTEGTPNVVLEALASGRPVVSTTVGGIPSVVTDRIQGRLVPPRDVPALTDALRDVLQSDAEPARIVQASGLFDWPENARRVAEVLEAACG